MLRVLVTRPEPGASRTARKLEEMGFEPLLLPLTETMALPVDAKAIPEDVAVVAITSANAVRHAPRDLIAVLSNLPCHAVGRRTAEAARKAGFLSVNEGPGDAEALADGMAIAFSGKTIVYLCGRVRFPAFEQKLEAAHAQVHAVETYDTLAVSYSDEAILPLISGQSVDAVLLYSAMAAAEMQTLARRLTLQQAFEKTRFFALSARIAAAFGDGTGKAMHVAARPDEEALLALLRARP
ncbi:uroporphyrinogen-III synthase [Mesorhizobium sp. ESP6-5]|uniref:Uroporphyrinogen-III synthase n=1 Tax=Mesorhizobium australicum (strain HAMBI 3006 / LMG 24608 / WSM2073) TaxID=754035 RepID=L0KE38_MESAW|nr:MULTISPECIES: uroporphyrinogen-III synthase [Mesorhizobium]AGB43597.1 uroporphyrinogen-III synthase [Mesorhizobium australicum WSM2073]MBZ9757619.1 uroporphyrinogen-III synthase [Mesorhizobium sp. ESP6-5]